MRIFIGFKDISGYYSNLKKGFNQLGLACAFVTKEKHPFKYGNEDESAVINMWRYFYKKNKSTSPKSRLKLVYKYLANASKLVLFAWAFCKFDIFIFGYSSTFFNYRELKLLKRFGKSIIYIFHGSDSRPPYMNSSYNTLPLNQVISLCKKKKKQINNIERYADFIICNPAQGQFHNRDFISRMYIGSPVEFSFGVDKENGNVEYTRILHAPSNPKIKGTEQIRAIIKKLKIQGYKIEYIEISGLPNHKVIEEIVKSDLVIDQLYADFPITGIVREAAFCGKPAIIGGYYADYISDDYHENLPIVYCHPDNVEKELIKLIEDIDLRNSLGEQAKSFIEIHGSPRKVAERFLMLLNNNFSQSWYYNPRSIEYIHGFGMNEEELKSRLKSIIDFGGKEGLLVSEKPVLESKLIEFANS